MQRQKAYTSALEAPAIRNQMIHSPTHELTLPSQYAGLVIWEPQVMLHVCFRVGGGGQAGLPGLAQLHTPSDVGRGCP
jgi:hypothetical protein